MKMPKSIGGWFSLAFKITGAIVAAGPLINVLINDVPSGKYQSIPNDALFAYTGLGGSTTWNSQQAAIGIGSLIGGAGLAKIGSLVGRWLR